MKAGDPSGALTRLPYKERDLPELVERIELSIPSLPKRCHAILA
jgi:hypothetical protein